jgi:hypothetical protein
MPVPDDSGKPLSKPAESQGNNSAPPIAPAPQISTYARLNRTAIGFVAIQEQHPFIFLCLWVLCGLVTSVWTICQFVQQGGGFVTFVIAVIILFIFSFCFYSDWQYTKANKGSILFWKPWIWL